MKKIFFLLFLTLPGAIAFAQVKEQPVYLQFPTIPPFRIMSVPDSTGFEKEDLKKHRPVLVFLFDPECDHCHQATKELLANIAAFKKAQVVMASSQDFKLLKDFYAEFDIAAYPNIKMGRDAGYFLGTFFGISSYPAIFLYDKKGKFIRAYRPGESFEGIAADLFK